MHASIEQFVPVSFVYIFYAIIFFGVCINIAIILILLKKKQNGVLSTILQLTLVDVMTSPIALTEIWAINNNRWIFPPKMCPYFVGTEILFATLTLYLIVCLMFHSLFFFGTRTFELENNRNPLTSCEDDGSEEFLVVRSRSESSIPNRTLIVDYRAIGARNSTFYPSLVIWLTCISLSVPDYLSTNAVAFQKAITCINIGKLDGHLQNLPLIFRSVVPLTLLLLSLVLLLIRYCRKPKNLTDSKKLASSRSSLSLAMLVTLLYFVTSLQRHIAYFIDSIRQSEGGLLILPSAVLSSRAIVILSMVHYVAPIFRIIVYFLTVPELPETFRKRKPSN